ncbi:hypothetical protein U5801_20005 [Lamprobacter modestohalophilus]|uniref:hypothetical protein n=1 Tax=Lamprobacter modestohalophilus TaxID=1064514 RepID=UPI002ADEE58A|nr:hypothetical protein [Lamprobacter modestohalophilus]MEA1052073.1 hypothetical protein [Lamprobacter modestohalophilus]
MVAKLTSWRPQHPTATRHPDQDRSIQRTWIRLRTLALAPLASALGLAPVGIRALGITALGITTAASAQDAQNPSRASWEQPRLAQQGYPQQPGQPWTFRPQPPTNARGVPPGSAPGQQPPAGYPQAGAWPQMPPAYPGAGSPSPYPGAYPNQQPGGYSSGPGYNPYRQDARPSAQPSLEVSLLDTQPYVQQPVLVRLDVLSSGNLATASPELAGFDAVLLEAISGPTTSVRGSGRERQIVNSYMLALTPLREGSVQLGPFEVSGTLAGGVPFSVVAAAPNRLEVRPVVASVRPWLPLQALQLTRELDQATPLAEGRPTTLTLRLQATGGTGAQLPNLEPMLTSNDFRAYREQTIIDTRLSDDGRTLQGIRTEIYTLVPYSGGRLQLPELRVNWWNVDTARRETSSVPIRRLSVAGESGPFGFGRGSAWPGWLGGGLGSGTGSSTDRDQGRWSGRSSEGWSWFWIPLGSIMLLLIGYWAGVWYRVKKPASSAEAKRASATSRPGWGQRLRSTSGQLSSRLSAGFRNGLRRLNPRGLVAALWLALRSRLQRLMPASLRVYRCAIAAERADSASEWALRFQSSACQSLRTPSREPLPRMADRILRLRPGADAARVRSLIQELDNALYNGGQLEMKRWKRELRLALRPGWGAFRGLLGERLQRARLPALNPSSADHSTEPQPATS